MKTKKETEERFIPDTGSNAKSRYVYNVGPTCIEMEEPPYDGSFHAVRTLQAKLKDSLFKFNQFTYNISDCTNYLGLKESLTENQHECLGRQWFAANECQMEPASFSTVESYSLDFEKYFTPVPLLMGYTKQHDGCGAVILRKITNDDYKWINKIVIEK